MVYCVRGCWLAAWWFSAFRTFDKEGSLGGSDEAFLDSLARWLRSIVQLETYPWK